ncbi:unnamed protein product [Closterium sp. NIES-54]
MDRKVTFKGGQLEDGDIVCVQRASLPPPTADGAAEGAAAAGNGGGAVRYPDVPSFLEYVRNRQVVHFRRLEKPKEDAFCLELSKQHTYDDVVARLAEEIGLDDPSKIRLTTHNCYSQQPKPPPIKYRGVDSLTDMLVHYNQSSDILYFETLDIPLPELQRLKTLNITFHNSKAEEVRGGRFWEGGVGREFGDPFFLVVGEAETLAEMKLCLCAQNIPCPPPTVMPATVPTHQLQTFGDPFFLVVGEAETLASGGEAAPLCLEPSLSPTHCLACHCTHPTHPPAADVWGSLLPGGGEDAETLTEVNLCLCAQNLPCPPPTDMPATVPTHQLQTFGDPFFLVVGEAETLAEVKQRIQARLGTADEEFGKWNFAFVALGTPEYLQDSDVVAARFQDSDVVAARFQVRMAVSTGVWFGDFYMGGLGQLASEPVRLGTADEEFDKWSFAFVALGTPEYLQDSDVVAARFQVSMSVSTGVWFGCVSREEFAKRTFACVALSTRAMRCVQLSGIVG